MLKKSLLYAAVCLEGISVLAIEMLASKILTPFLGSSLFVWTAVIGVTMTCLALGYFLGGKIKISSMDFFSHIWLFVAVYLSVTFLFVNKLFIIAAYMMQLPGAIGLAFGAALFALVMIGPPLLWLGTITSVAIGMHGESQNPGKIAGNVYFLSTIAGIASALVFGLLLIPGYGVPISLLILSLMSCLFALIFFSGRSLFWYFLTAVLVVGSCFFYTYWIQNDVSPGSRTFYLSDGILGQVKVLEKRTDSVVVRKLMVNNSTQSAIVRNDSTAASSFEYPHRIGVWASCKRPGAKALLLGFGAGCVAYEMQQHGYQSDIVDIDKRLFDIAMQFFFLKQDNLSFFTDDARHYVNTCGRRYDIVVIDINNAELLPSHLYTLEFFNELKKVLNPDALLIVNLQGYLKGPKSLLSASIYRTMQAAGFKVNRWFEYERYLGDMNYIATCSEKFPVYHEENISVCCRKKIDKFSDFICQPFKSDTVLPRNALVLHDDLPVLEYLNAQNVVEWRRYIIQHELLAKE